MEMYSGNTGRQNFLCNKNGKVSVWMGGYSDASIESNGTLPLGEWSHVAWVADGDVWRLYINGELDIEASGHAGHLLDESSPDGFVIGNSRSVNPNGASDALFAEVRVWKCARTKEEIKSAMNTRLFQTWRMKQLVGYWPLSDGEEAYVKNGNAVRNYAAAQISGYNSQIVAWSMIWLRDEDGYYAKGSRVAWTTTSTLPVSGKLSVNDQYAICNLGGHTPPSWGDYGCHTNAVNTQISAVSGSGDFTFMGWYQISDSSDGRSLNCLFAKAHGLHGDTHLMEHNGRLILTMIKRDGGYEESTIIVENALEKHRWHHVAIVKRQTQLSIYIDGELRGQQNDWRLTLPEANLHIGGTDQWGGRSFFGAFKNIGLWGQSMGRRSIIQYMSCLPDPEDPSLIGYWPMDEGEGNSTRNLKNPSIPAVPVGDGFFRWIKRANMPPVEGAFVPTGRMKIVVR